MHIYSCTVLQVYSSTVVLHVHIDIHVHTRKHLLLGGKDSKYVPIGSASQGDPMNLRNYDSMLRDSNMSKTRVMLFQAPFQAFLPF